MPRCSCLPNALLDGPALTATLDVSESHDGEDAVVTVFAKEPGDLEGLQRANVKIEKQVFRQSFGPIMHTSRMRVANFPGRQATVSYAAEADDGKSINGSCTMEVAPGSTCTSGPITFRIHGAPNEPGTVSASVALRPADTAHRSRLSGKTSVARPADTAHGSRLTGIRAHKPLRVTCGIDKASPEILGTASGYSVHAAIDGDIKFSQLEGRLWHNDVEGVQVNYMTFKGAKARVRDGKPSFRFGQDVRVALE